jgi:primosomal protein N' (replication factor Y) (superfamily II helicase)
MGCGGAAPTASTAPDLTHVARVLPDLTGLDKEFDYLVPAELADQVRVGSIVRVPLHGRSVRGWVVALDPELAVEIDRLRPVAKVSSWGPSADAIELARWASVRWAAGRLRPFLVAASPATNVAGLPAARRTGRPVEPVHAGARELLARGGGALRLPPSEDVVPVLAAAAGLGPTLVVAPSADRARLDAIRLRRAGLAVAHVPDEWAAAAGGVDVVIGARTAAWAPCPDLAAVVVVDEHDEALQEERAPTWHARDVVVERARRAGAPVLLVSPCPTVAGLAAASERLHASSIDAERAGWPIVEVVDRSRDEPWRTSLVSSPLVVHLRRADRIVVCVHNTPGRARILACRSCRSLARCERCEAAVGLSDQGTLVCRRCGTERPATCLVCNGTAFSNLKPGVTRLREELEAAAGRPVVAVTGRDPGPPPAAGVYVGTEAVLHRVEHADVVAFLDIDLELLAPRYRAAEQAMALLARAARMLGPRRERRDARLLLQTFVPGHEVIRAALLAEPGRLTEPERERRRALELPPYAALASVSGPGSDAVAAVLRAEPDVAVGGSADRYVVRAASWDRLGAALIAAPRPKGSRVRVEVDPPRL